MSKDDFATMIFQMVFCATSATIVSGAMAERTKFSAYNVVNVIKNRTGEEGVDALQGEDFF